MIEEYPRGSKWLVLVSLASLSLFLLFKLSTLSVSSLHLEAIFILAFLSSLSFRRSWQLKNDMAIKLLLLGCLLPLFSFLINYISNKELAVEYFEFDKLVKLMGFVAIGFWLGGTLKNIYIFLIIVLLGLVVALFNVILFKRLNLFLQEKGSTLIYKMHSTLQCFLD